MAYRKGSIRMITNRFSGLRIRSATELDVIIAAMDFKKKFLEKLIYNTLQINGFSSNISKIFFLKTIARFSKKKRRLATVTLQKLKRLDSSAWQKDGSPRLRCRS